MADKDKNKRIDPFDVEALEKSLNDSATRVSTIWLSFVAFSAYLAAAVSNISHRQLLLEEAMKLPTVNIELSLLASALVLPTLYVIFHVYVLLQVLLLSRTAAAYNTAVHRAGLLASEDASLRQRLANTLFAQIFAGSPRERSGWLGWLLRAMAWITLAIAPILILLNFQFAFLPYHSHLATWTHRLLCFAELVTAWLMWPLVLDARRELDLPTFKRRLKRMAAFPKALAIFLLWSLLPVNKWSVDWPTVQQKREFRRLRHEIFPATAFLLFILCSLSLATFPGEPHVNLASGYAWSSVRCERWFAEGYDRLQLSRVDVVDDEKLTKIEKVTFDKGIAPYESERTRIFRGRDLVCSDLSDSDLRRADFSNAHLYEANLRGAALQGASFDSARLHGAFFRGAQLQGATFNEAKLHGADFINAQLQGAVLDGAELQGATLKYTNLRGASLRDTQLHGAEFRSAYLQAAVLDSAQLYSTSFADARLNGASLDGVLLQGADLVRANLQDAVLSDAYTWQARGARCDEARVIGLKVEAVVEILLDDENGSRAVPAEPAAIEKFIDRTVSNIKSMKGRTRERMRQSLLVDPNNDNTAEIAKTWTDCERSSSSISQAEFDIRHVATLLNIVCNAARDRGVIARGVIRNWISEGAKRQIFSATLARGLLSEDGNACAATKDLDEPTKERLHAAIARMPNTSPMVPPGHSSAPFPSPPSRAKSPASIPAYPRSFVGVSLEELPMVALTFPDGARRDYPDSITGLDIAKGISPSLAKRTVAMALDGQLADLTDPIGKDAKIEFVARDDPRALELIRHDAAHVLAEAVQTLWPGTQVTIGPVIENGFYYDFFRNQPFSLEDFPAIEKKMREIIARDKPFTKEVWSREEAKRVFRDKGESFKVELIDAIPQDQEIKIYRQGDWFDLCRGPHMTSTAKVGNAFKLMKVAGAYWRGDANNPMLTRIYGTAFAKQEDLDAYLKQIEEAEKRDHRKLGRELDLFHFQEEGPGVVFWHAKGWSLFQSIIAYMRRRLADDYDEVNAPQMLDKALWETSGHWGWYRENMFAAQSAGDEAEDKRWFAIKPMNCPGHVLIFKHGLKSYRDLPIRLAEFGMVHRYEPHGALHGLLRVRGFTQDDAHIFCTEDQLAAECLKINDLILSVYADFGFTSDILIKLATRPEKRVGTDAMWDHAEDVLRAVLKKIEAESGGRIKTGINPGEGTFYGPKFEYVLRDAIGRDWQCGTTQVDFNLPERFGAFYIDADGEKKQPVMVHRAICGSLERFTGILIENFAGHFPLWLAPRQIVIATITSDADDYARDVLKAAKRAGLRADLDPRNEKINYKVREHSLAKVPVLLVVGKKEAETRAVSMRRLGSEKQTVMPLDAALAVLADEAVPPDVKRMRDAA